MTRKIAKFQVTSQLIKESLALPDEMKIYNIIRHPSMPDVFEILVEHPKFEEIPEGSDAPEVAINIEANYENRPSTWITLSFS